MEKKSLARFSRPERTDHWLLTVRTFQIDQLIGSAIQKGVRTILNLGAGLDTSPYRLDPSDDSPTPIGWFEADFPDVIVYKNEKLKDETPKFQLQRIPADLGKAAERLRVFDLIKRKPGPLLVMTSGFLTYPFEQNISELALDLLAIPSCRYWLMDVFNRVSLESSHPLELFGWELKEFLSLGDGALKLNHFPKGVDPTTFKSLRGFFRSGLSLFSPKMRYSPTSF